MHFKKGFKKLTTLVILGLLSLVALAFAMPKTIKALSTTDTVTYPFVTGEDALKYAHQVTGQAAQTEADTFQWFEAIFDAPVDLTSAKYLAVEYKNTVGNPGLTIGIMSQSTRFGTYVDGKKVFFAKQDGTVSEASVLYASVNLGTDAGMILLPMESLSIVGWGNQEATLASATSFFFETNAKYNWGFQMSIGEIGYYTGEPGAEGTAFHKIVDLSMGPKKTQIYQSNVTTTWTEYEDPQFPFAKGEDALKNAPLIKGQPNKTDANTFQWFEAIFDASTDLTSAKYLAVEYQNTAGDPGLTIGIMSQGTRFGTYVDGKEIQFVKQDGTKATKSVLYSSVNLGTDAGMILIPIESLSIVSWGNQEATLAAATSFFFETNAVYNWGFQMKIGEIGYYTGEVGAAGTKFHKILDLSEVKKDKVYSADVTVEWPEVKEPITGKTITYPFRTGEFAFNGATIWAGTTTGDANDNWQTLTINIPETNLSTASYLAIQYMAKAGTPGLTYGVQGAGTRFSIVGSSGEDLYIVNTEGLIEKACTIQYDAANVGKSGALLIPVELLNKQFGDNADLLNAVSQICVATNSKYNWAFEAGFGEVGYYTGEVGEEGFTFHKLIDLTDGAQIDKFNATSDNADNRSSVYTFKVDKMVYGDTKLIYTATGKRDDSVGIWDGGALGEQKMTQDSYGDDALLLTCKGVREGADAYTAFTIADGMTVDWSNAKGVTLWAKNLSTKEISFNLEIDVTSSHTPVRARFNITQGNRFWLYDVNTGKQTIYMTRPCVTLPVGFEGWVRIPFTAFNQAQWSVDSAGAFPREYFMTEGSNVPYLAITVYSGNYTDCPFAVNKFGGYETTPGFVSALIPQSETNKDIPHLMGLE